MARVAGVSLEWLATGKSHPEGEPPATAEPGQSQLDLDTLEVVIAKTLEAFEERRPELSAEARARIIRLIYEFYTKQGKPMDQASLDNVIELAAFR